MRTLSSISSLSKSMSITIEQDEETALLSEEHGNQYNSLQETKNVKQGLHKRHMQMIGLAGSVGTGLFLNIGSALASGGPIGSMLSYTLVGLVVCNVVLIVGEMGTLLPLNGGIVRYTQTFLDPAASFAIGWNMVYSCVMALPAEIVAASILIQYWTSITPALWITISAVIVLITALLFVQVFGEVEYITAILKITLVVGINILALYVTCGGGPEHEVIGFKYWSEPGPFVQYLGIPGQLGQFVGVWACARTAFFAYAGMESFTATAAEIRNPRQEIPATARRIFFRVFFFYVLTLFTLGLIIPSDDPNLLRSVGNASQSPFVIAARRAGLKAIPSIVNTIALTTSWSSANNCVVRGSRFLYGLTNAGHAPKIFNHVNRFGVPHIGIALHGVFILLAYVTMYSSGSVVFGWLQSMVAMGVLVTWIVICITYLRFFYACNHQGIDRKLELPWTAPLQPYATWISLGVSLVVLAAGHPSTFVPGQFDIKQVILAYLNLVLVLGLYVGYKVRHKSQIVSLAEIPIRHLINIANDDLNYKPISND